MGTNGQGESRLDQLERLMVQHVIENHDAHAEFRSEHRVLLVAQMALNEQLTALAETVGRQAESLDRLDVAMLETTEKLNALIRTVDGIIRRDDRDGETPQ